jgi:hypothetical protein
MSTNFRPSDLKGRQMQEENILWVRNYRVSFVEKVLKDLDKGLSQTQIHKKHKVPRPTVRYWKAHQDAGGIFLPESEKKHYSEQQKVYAKTEVEDDSAQNRRIITTRSLGVKTLEGALRAAKVDRRVWEVDRHVINFWEVTTKLKKFNKKGIRVSDQPHTYTNYQVKVWLKRKKPELLAMEDILAEIKRTKIIQPKIKRIPLKKMKHRRTLEVSIMDPHLGLSCYKPGADNPWSIDKCESMVMTMIDRLIELNKVYGPYERILFPFGNDFLHADTVFHTTTEGTKQPEMESWQYVYMRAEKLGIAMINRLREVAPVHVVSVMGNHARQSEFALGRTLNAYFHTYNDVTCDVDSSPYKFYPYGVCLVGFEHGHSIKQTVRLAALMANECRINGWQEARWCEWHLGDQHRKGSAKPVMMEEQGVSVEFLPGLTPPNEWHKIKSFNWQKRAGLAFVWDKVRGPIARTQISIDNYTGEILGG